MRFDDLNETPVAIIVHYACHPTTMAWQNPYFTPDYPGVTRQVVEQPPEGYVSFFKGLQVTSVRAVVLPGTEMYIESWVSC